MKLFLILLIISACSLIKAPQNNFKKQWTGQSILVLNNHPQFSLFPREESFINKRETIVKYLSTVFVDDENLSCFPLNENMNSEIQSGIECSDLIEETCTYKFVIKDKKVMNIEITGLSCVIECSLFPKGECN